MCKMMRLVCAGVALTAFAFMISGSALASDECKAGCEVAYKRCMKGADGDTDKSLDCSDAKQTCLDGCN